jgi:hypothetical protein
MLKGTLVYMKKYMDCLCRSSQATTPSRIISMYILKMLIDILFYFIVTLLIFKGLELTGLKLKTHWTFIAVGILTILFRIFVFYTTTFESSFKFINDFDFKVNSNQLHFGTYPW